MTRPAMRIDPIKVAVAGFAAACAIAALGILGTASVDRRPLADPAVGSGAASLETKPLGR